MDTPSTLFGAWRALGLDAAPRGDGGVTFCCPRCAEPTRLDVEAGVALCPGCAWGATGEPWEIAQAAASVVPTSSSVPSDLAATLERIRFNHATPPPPPVALFSLAGHTIATAENLMVVQAKMKAGKSAAIGAMIASTMQPEGDCLWFASSNAEGRAVLHFDTEQSSWDHYNLIVRSLRRAGRTDPPSWLYSYHIKGQSIATARSMVATALERAAQECGGIHSCTVDGIADLCADVNDPAESNALVAEMEALAMQYKTLIVCVLHENHGSDSGKTRGHLGSQLARKAETNLRLEKNAEGTTIMFADTSRSVHITKKMAPGFKWDDDARAHVSVLSSVMAIQQEKLRAELQEIANLIRPDGVSWSELRAAITVGKECSNQTAERHIKKMTEFFMITKKGDRWISTSTLNPHEPSSNPQ